MFKFFRDNLSVNSIFACTEHSIFENKSDVFNIAELGGVNPNITGDGYKYIPLALQINKKMQDPVAIEKLKIKQYLWQNNLSTEDYYKRCAEAFIESFPAHKFIAVADKSEVNFNILDIIMEHFGSKLIILSAVNDTWTGYCSYPNFYNCDKFKTEHGCDSNCPAISQNENNSGIDVRENYLLTKRFIDKNKNSVYLNVGNSYCLQQANESTLFADVQKFMIPLKNVYESDNFEDLWKQKSESKRGLSERIKNFATGNIFYVMWSAMYLNDERKGLSYFLNSINILKNLTKDNLLSDMVFIFAGNMDEQSRDLINKLKIKFIAQKLPRNVYMEILKSSDVYCNTSVEEAGPRTTYESAANGTPVISFDRCNAIDFVNDNNGALIDTYDVKMMAEKIYNIYKLSAEERKNVSKNTYETYKNLMDTDKLVDKWEHFFSESIKHE